MRSAIHDRDPLPGTFGFAGELPDRRLVRDVLGRELLYRDSATEDWSFDPGKLADSEMVPPGTMVSEGEVTKLWTLPESDPTDAKDGIARLESALNAAFDGLAGNGDVDAVPIGFSGGLDSAVLAARMPGPLYVVGFPESHDIVRARSAAEALGRELRVVELDHGTVETLIPEVAKTIGRTNAMDVQIALPLVALSRRVAEDGFSRLLLGQGADELFGGYAKVAKAPEDPRVEAETIIGARDEVIQGLPAQLERDIRAVRRYGVEPVMPYLHDEVIRSALTLPGTALVRGEERKVGLREVASKSIPAGLADQPKKAMQYGTLVSREMDRLSRQAGFKRRMDDHLTSSPR